ncbi:MAG: superoxide dismutase family protein [Planctomycetota bacterium]|nr:superoxide dismutase family protein [Planctomycetota bacterium]
MRHTLLAALVLVAVAALTTNLRAEEKAPAPITQAICVLTSTEGNKAHGVLKFVQEGDKLKIVGDVEGLTPDGKHAIHIHEFGDVTSKDGTSTGGHYNPEGHDHALPEKAERHAGDLGNLQADKDGKAHLEITVENASLAGKNPVLGRSIIVHAKADDGGQPTGNAGARIAHGVIGVANPKSM